MPLNLALPVSHHVASREATKSLRQAAADGDTWNVLLTQVMGPARDRFSVGERLSTTDYASLVSNARKTLLGLDPVIMEDEARQASRAKPKGEQHEFRAVGRMGVDAARTRLYGLVGIRLYANRKKVELEYDMLGLDVTGHLLERTMQRDLASWTGRFREVDKALNDAAGLAVVWRYAFASGALKTDRLAMPLGDGLMLGNLLPSRVHNISKRASVNRNGAFMVDMGRSAFHVPDYQDAPDLRYLRAAFATAVGNDVMSIPQVDLRDALFRFLEGNDDVISRIGASATWRACALRDNSTFAALSPDIERLVGELAGILNRPDMDHALNHGHTEEELSWGSTGPLPGR